MLLFTDYVINGPILISIFDNRIEIVTIGGLVKGISFDDIMLGVSVLKNEHLANVFYRLKLIEAYGTGMLKIHECYSDYAVKAKIEVSDNAFKITLPNINYSGNGTLFAEDNKASLLPGDIGKEREEIVISLFEKQDTIVRKDIEKILNVSQATAILIVRELVEKGVLIKEGNGKYLRYRLAEG